MQFLLDLDWDDVFHRWGQLILIAALVLVSWIGALFRKIFIKLPEEIKKLQREMEQQNPPMVGGWEAPKAQAAEPAKPANLQEFFEAVQKEADRAQRRAEGGRPDAAAAGEEIRPPGAEDPQWESLEWETVEPQPAAVPAASAGPPVQDPYRQLVAPWEPEPPQASQPVHPAQPAHRPQAAALDAPPNVQRALNVATFLTWGAGRSSGDASNTMSFSLDQAMVIKEILGPPRAFLRRHRCR